MYKSLFLLVCAMLSGCAMFTKSCDTYLLEHLRDQVEASREDLQDLYSLVSDDVKPYKVSETTADQDKRSIFKCYPNLREDLPYLALGNLPTPVQKLDKLGEHLGHLNLYLKNDGLTGHDGLYGGNKVRKLEFILADALRYKAKMVITCGGAGSNHALATACYAKQLGLQCSSILVPQMNSRAVRNNLLLSSHYGANLCDYPSLDCFSSACVEKALQCKKSTGSFPYIIPLGGSSVLGTVGFVNAAFELNEQIRTGVLPEPDFIYLPVGSAGTAAGLLLGLKAAGLKSKVLVVKVGDEDIPKEELIKEKFDAAKEFLCMLDSTFPKLELEADDFSIEREFWGGQYGLFTQECVEALKLMQEYEGVQLDGTYSGKTFATLLDHIKQGRLGNKKVLFWNTYCGLDFSEITKQVDYKILPKSFHHYFEEDVQILDR